MCGAVRVREVRSTCVQQQQQQRSSARDIHIILCVCLRALSVLFWWPSNIHIHTHTRTYADRISTRTVQNNTLSTTTTSIFNMHLLVACPLCASFSSFLCMRFCARVYLCWSKFGPPAIRRRYQELGWSLYVHACYIYWAHIRLTRQIIISSTWNNTPYTVHIQHPYRTSPFVYTYLTLSIFDNHVFHIIQSVQRVVGFAHNIYVVFMSCSNLCTWMFFM